MSDLTRRVTQLSPEKQALLSLRLKQEQADSARPQTIPRRAATGSAPLSFAQQRLWFLDQLEPGSPFYTISAAIQLSGRLERAALERSLHAIMQRHDILRATFKEAGGQPVQVIPVEVGGSGFALPLIDLQHLPPEERAAEAQRRATEEARQPFDLANGPLVRARLLQLAASEHVLLLTMHHIISDGWSVRVFVRELATLYTAHAGGQPAALPELPIQYADFAAWQRAWLQADDGDRPAPLQTQLAYWQEPLRGSPPLLELPTDRPRPPVQTYHGAHHTFTVPQHLAAALKTLSQNEDSTLFMTMLAAFLVQLHRYSGQHDLCVGTPVANRQYAELESLIGFFVNTLVLRTDLSGEPGFRDLVRRVREVVLDAHAHQDLPFELLVEALHPQRDMSYTPLFQVMFDLQPAPLQALTLPDLTTSLLEIETGTAKFDLLLLMEEQPDGLRGTFEYNTDLFDATTIARMAGHFQTLLAGIVANPDQSIATLPLMTAAERRQLLVEWNATWTDYPRDSSIPALFEAQAAATPDAVALVFEGEQVTYADLNARANRLAHYLQTLGVGPETLVGLCVERSLEMVVATLAILKAGGAYVPLDPTYPPERLAFMLEDTQVPVLLTHGAIDHRRWTMDDGPQTTIIRLDTDWPHIAQSPATNPTSGVTPDTLAYVMYTSGSTGRPKGICVTHRNVIRLVKQTNFADLTAEEVFLQFAPISFDAATLEIWGALLNGARLVVAPPHDLTLEELGQVLREHGITTLWLTAGLFHQMVEHQLDALRGVRQLLAGGDVLSVPHVQRVLRELPGCRLINGYGPTENTTFTCCHSVTDRDTSGPSVPIGRPIANTQVYLLDRHQQPVPIGVPGELHAGGDGVARGYLNRPELTAEKFVPNPFGARERGSGAHGRAAAPHTTAPQRHSATRLYRTGDRARYRPDGIIEFLGRFDHQVKIRGFRIELGEIETVLGQHPAVQQVVVVARADVPGDKRLVAYVVPTTGSRAGRDGSLPAREPATDLQTQLRAFLAEKLPDYMVPTAFVMLDRLPLTPNGKVDRQTLPAPDGTRPELATDFVAPHSPTEEILAGIWSQVLGINQIGTHDSFFELGGHSLLATQLVSRIRDIFRVELPLRTVFEAPTVAALATRIDTTRQSDRGEPAPPILPVPRPANLPLSFAQQRLWFLDQLEPDSPLYNIPIALRMTGALDVTVLELSLRMIVRRHESLRTVFATVDGQAVQVILPDLTFPVSRVDLQALSPEEREAEALRLATEESRRPFDLAYGPLLRVLLFRLAEEEHMLVLVMHHIVSDGWSMGVIVRELAALYQAFRLDQPVPLPALSIQYADFAHWQRQWLRGAALESQLAYWRQQLGDSPPLLELPTDRPRPAVQTYRGAQSTFALPRELLAALKDLSGQEHVTLFMTLLAAFTVLLHRYSGQHDICVGTPIANRTHSAVENLVGFFVNTLTLRTDLSGNPPFRDLLRQVREITLGAYTHQDVPFEMVVDALQPERNLSHTPLFQVMFALQNAPLQPLEVPGLTFTPVTIDSGTAKFDLTLVVAEVDDQSGGLVEYNTDLFDAATIDRMIGHFQALLAGIVANPDQSIATLPLLTAAERQQILVAWNATTTDFPADQCVHWLFEQQAARTPDAVAAIFEGEQVTYGELNRRANQLAHHLQTLGVGSQVPVGLATSRSLEMVVAMLAILKAGGAYVPLDPTYPAERLAFMLDDAQAPVLITQRAMDDGSPPARGWTTNDARPGTAQRPIVVQIDTDWPTIAREPDTNPTSSITANDPAYVMYTSGSTGRPKGVIIPHQAITRLVCNTNYLHITAADRIAQASNASFDAATFEIWGALLHGARLVGITREVALDPQAFAAELQAQGISIMFLTTALFNHLAREVPDAFHTLRCLLFGGEAVDPRWVREVLAHRPPARLLHVYGPTETTTFATWYPVQTVPAGATTIPIGYPLANTHLYVLDQHRQPVPIGVPGELYIGGPGVAHGYLHRPELTAEKFVPNPFGAGERGSAGTIERWSGEHGSAAAPHAPPPHRPTAPRLYRTGDLVRYRPDGSVEFLGRMDTQVKLRGFRIELSEIEAVLGQHPAVRDVVVLAREDTPGDKRLVAYVVPTTDHRPPTTGSAVNQQPTVGAGELRAFLAERLPEYMLPAAFVPLAAFPLTPNGKVDRQALPAPERTRHGLEGDYVAPRTPIEQALAEIWAQVLGINQVGIHDNFFALGGDSILSIQIIARANQAGLRLTPRHLFQYSTIAGLAEVAGTARPIQAEQGLVTGPVPLTPIQRWFFEQQLPEPHHWNQTVLLEVPHPLDQALLETTFQHLQAHHDALRLRFTRSAADWEQVCTGLSVDITAEWHDLAELPASAHAAAIESRATELQASLRLTEGPLLRAAYFARGSARSDRLLLVMHHLMVDGVSWRIILEDLQSVYRHLSQGQAAHLPPKTTSFQHWARRLAEHAQSDALRKEADYWLATPERSPARLPLDFPAGANTEDSERDVRVALSAEETRALLQEVPSAYGTEINDVLLTALAQTLAQWTGSRLVLIDLEGHGREALFEDVDLSRTVGWFTTIFPVWLDLRAASGPGETLMAVKEQLRRIPNRGIGYGLLRYLSAAEDIAGRLRALPQAEVIFNYLGQSDQTLPDTSLFRLTYEPSGPIHSRLGRRSHPLSINSGIAGGQLQMAWSYSTQLHRHATIEQLAHNFMLSLRTLIAHCQSPDAVGYTPSDFQDVALSQDEVEALVSEISTTTGDNA